MTPLLITPVKNEKAYMSAGSNVYIFTVPLSANKQQISQAVQSQFSVKVVGVTSLIQKGKQMAFSRGKRARPGKTFHKDIKRAYVSLTDGDSIKIFDEAEADELKAAPTENQPSPTLDLQQKTSSKLKTVLRRGSARGGDK